MSNHGDEYSKEEIVSLLRKKGEKAYLIDWFEDCIDFHSFIAPGLLIGVYMVDYALDLLEANTSEKLYAVCETPKCAPDPLQVIAHCTIGNNRLRVIPIGRFAITMNRQSLASSAEGVRVWLDHDKLGDCPIIESWFSNTPAFDGKAMKKRLVEEILSKGRTMLSYEKVRIPVTTKKKWRSAVCASCGEQVPEDALVNGLCPGCSSQKYYEKI